MKKVDERKAAGIIRKAMKGEEDKKDEIVGDYVNCPEGCDTVHGRMVKRGEIKKQYIKVMGK